MRRLTPIALISILVLSGCAPSAEPQDPTSYAAMSAGLSAQCDSYETGDAVKQVKVTGDFGTQPEVSFPTPLSGTGVETAVIIEGNGGKIVGNQRVALHFTGFNAGTGEQFQGSEFGSDATIFQDLVAGDLPDFCKALTGVQVGSRIAVLFDAASAHQNMGVSSLGISENDGILFVFDVVDAYLPRAIGSSVAPVAGMPTVILAPNGQPGIQVPATDAPTELKTETLIQGQGETVNIGDSVVVHYSGWTWQGDLFDSSWDKGTPANFQVSSDNLIEGFVQALDGVKVGSQIVAVIPPSLGYGDNAQGSIPAGSTLIFVIDVLGKE